jgi:DNA-binding response OmpR family regulator
MPSDLALNQIWKESNYLTKRSKDVYITKLRKHLALDSNITIETFHQMGFQFNVLPQ